MNSFLRNLGLAAATALLLAACGGGGGGGDDIATPPTAVATADQTTAHLGTVVTLDGSSSATPNGGSLTYQWSLISQPDGSTATLSGTTDAKPTLTPDKPGDYVAGLVVNDGRAGSTSARVTITVTNPDPVAAIAQATQGVLVGATVTLDGSGSLPPTGANAADLHYQWQLVAQPEGGSAALSGDNAATATFLAAKVGVYRATLTVSHGSRTSASVETVVTVSTSNSAAIVKLDVPLTAVRGATVVLDASASSDPDGDRLSYRWSFPSAIANSSNPAVPRGSVTTITRPTSAKAEFVPDVAGTYTIDYVVYDASVASTQRVTVKVVKPDDAVNAAPVAVIGTGNALEYEVGAYAFVGANFSYDIDGDPLSYQWTWWNTATPGTRTVVAGATGGGLNLGNRVPAGTYQAELVVNDGQADSAPATGTFVIRTGANVAPAASAKVDIAKVLVGQALTFDASGSTDRNGDPLAYQWTLGERPDGSNAVLQNATSAQARLVTDQPGVYAAWVQVTDAKGAVSARIPADNVSAFAKAKNNAPVVGAFSLTARDSTFSGYTSETAPGQPFIISTTNGIAPAAQMFDPDNDVPLYYVVSPSKQPAGSEVPSASDTALLENGAWRSWNWTPAITVPGDYEFEVIASDGLANSEPKRLAFTAIADRTSYPTLLLESVGPTPSEATEGNQEFFPYTSKGADSIVDAASGTVVIAGYRLTAFDRDYTVTDLQTSSADGTHRPAFQGLANGQVILKGQSVLFTLVRPVMAEEKALWAGLYALEGEAFNQEYARLQTLYDRFGFTWSFRLGEKEGYRFQRGPGTPQ